MQNKNRLIPVVLLLSALLLAVLTLIGTRSDRPSAPPQAVASPVAHSSAEGFPADPSGSGASAAQSAQAGSSATTATPSGPSPALALAAPTSSNSQGPSVQTSVPQSFEISAAAAAANPAAPILDPSSRPAAPTGFTVFRTPSEILAGKDLTDPVQRAQAVAEMSEAEEVRYAAVLAKAEQMGIPVRVDGPGHKVSILYDIRAEGPLYRNTLNTNAAISTGANLLNVAPYGLNGNGMTVGVWDAARARTNHVELIGKVTVKDSTTANDDHSTHVAGTIAAKGVDPKAKGMGTNTLIHSYDWNNDYAEMTAAGAATAGDGSKLPISNHSYGYGATNVDMGRYELEASTTDTIAYKLPYYLVFWAAGNEQTDLPALGGYQSITFVGLAKNILTVGAADDAVTAGVRDPSKATLASFSSMGPCDDGRIKPDVVANGVDVYSCVATSTNSYDGTYSGTSMATPNAAGSAALLEQLYKTNFSGQLMAASMLKGLLIHTADDRGRAGPDYQYGWGLINVKAAADVILAQKGSLGSPKMITGNLTTTNKVQNYTFSWDGVSPIRATLVWTDPEGTAVTNTSDIRTRNLIHDLDLKVTAPDGTTTTLPYVMPFVGTWTTNSMTNLAIKATNKVDNVERVDLPTPTQPGTYTVSVGMYGTNNFATNFVRTNLDNSVTNITFTNQLYSLIVTGGVDVPANPPPTVALTAPAGDVVVSPGATVNLAATAADLNVSNGPGTVAQVEFLANNTVINTDTNAPYSFAWNPALGNYAVSARATDTEGASATSAAVNVEVRNQIPVITSAQTSPAGTAFSDEPVSVTGVVANDPEGSAVTISYQWQSSANGTTWTNAGGLTASTLPAASANAGLLWRCVLTPNDGVQNGDAFTGPSVTISSRPLTTASVGSAYTYQSGLYVPTVTTSFTRPVIINEFSQGPSGTAEWIELLTLQATSLRYYDIADGVDNFLLFLDDAVWDNIPAGTTIVIYNGASKDPLLPADDLNPNDDGRMVISSQNASYFDTTAGSAWPGFGNSGDAIYLNDADSVTVAEIGYGNFAGASPNVGTVGAGRAVYYVGDTEEGITSRENWRTTSSATARSLNGIRALGDLFVSEYVEGSGNNKALEIYNPSGSAVNLTNAGYVVQIYFNGSSSPATSIALTGNVLAGGVHVLASTSATNTLTALANQTSGLGSSWFNGDDAVVLRKGGTNGTIVDVIGQIGFDPGTQWTNSGVSTVDRTLRRKSSVVQGDTNGTNAFNPSTEWDSFAQDTFNGLGSHTVVSGPALSVSATPVSFPENAGTNASTGTVRIPVAVASNVLVTLSSGSTNAATVPASVTVPAGSTNAPFTIAAVDNLVADGTRLVAISAAASGYSGAQVQLTVTDNEASLEGVTPGAGNTAANTQFIANLRAGAFGQTPLYRTGPGHQMPPGLVLDPNTGLLSGTPTQVGTYTIVIERYNALGDVVSQTFQLIVSAAGTSYDTWISGYSGLSDTTRVGDPEKDGLSNLAEYFLGLNPSASDSGMTSGYQGGVMTMDYRKSKTTTGVTGRVKWHPNMTNGVPWSTNGVTDSFLSDQGTYEMRRATITVPPGETSRFMRLEVTEP